MCICVSLVLFSSFWRHRQNSKSYNSINKRATEKILVSAETTYLRAYLQPINTFLFWVFSPAFLLAIIKIKNMNARTNLSIKERKIFYIKFGPLSINHNIFVSPAHSKLKKIACKLYSAVVDNWATNATLKMTKSNWQWFIALTFTF